MLGERSYAGGDVEVRSKPHGPHWEEGPFCHCFSGAALTRLVARISEGLGKPVCHYACVILGRMPTFNAAGSPSTTLRPYHKWGVACLAGACVVNFGVVALLMLAAPSLMGLVDSNPGDPVGRAPDVNYEAMGVMMVVAMVVQAIAMCAWLGTLVLFVLDLVQFGNARAELTDAVIAGEITRADGEDRSPYLSRGIAAIAGSVLAALIAYAAVLLSMPTASEITDVSMSSRPVKDLLNPIMGRVALSQFVFGIAAFVGALGLVSIVRGIIQRHFEMKLARKL